MTRRPCPVCGARVPVIHEGAAIDANYALVAVYAEHDPCPGSYAPVDAPAPMAPVAAAPQPTSRAIPDTERPAAALAILREGPATAADVAAGMRTSERVAQRVLLELVEAGQVVRARMGGRGMAAPYRYALPCPLGGPVAREVWSALLEGPVDACELAERLRRPAQGVRSAIGRMRAAGVVVQPDGRWGLRRARDTDP